MTTNAEPIVFMAIEAGHNKEIRVQRSMYKNREVLAIQKFWREDEDMEWQFGKAVTFNFEAIDEIIEGLQAMKEYCENKEGDI